MKPFLHDEVFRPYDNPTVQVESVGNTQAIVADYFFENLSEIRSVVKSTPPGNWKYNPEGRNFKDYYDCRITFPAMQTLMFQKTKELILEHFGVKTECYDDVIGVNWFKQIHEKRNDYAFPHSDGKPGKYTCLVYLNDTVESSGGTGFFSRKVDSPVWEDGTDYWPPKGEWNLDGHIAMVPNRLVIFPAEYLHAAYHPMNSFYNFSRLTLVYWMYR